MDDLRRQRRDRLLVFGLVLLILALSLVYSRAALRAAREIVADDALDRNLATAELGARLIDAQCDAVLSVLNAIAGRRPLAESLVRLQAGNRAEEPVIRRHLQEALELLPALTSVAAYSTDGRLVAGEPASNVGRDRQEPGGGTHRRWVIQEGVPTEGGSSRSHRAPYVGNVLTRGPSGQEERVVLIAVPVGPRGSAGSLTALFQLGIVEEWLKPLRFGFGTGLFVADAGGQVVATSNAFRGTPNRAQAEVVRQALAKEHGRLETPRPDDSGTELIGYWPATVPGWAVVVVQPKETALAGAELLLRRLWGLIVPLLALMLGAGWAIEALYRRQARLARQNAVLSRDLAVQNEQLRAANHAKSEFLANVSHDLRTPLASIKASISGLLEPDIEWDRRELQGFLTLVNEETDRLSARVRNLLDMARLEAGALPMQKEVCDLTDIVASALERVEPLTRGRPVEASFPDEPLLVEADYAQIETVVLNLLENAVKYSPAGSPLQLRGLVADGPVAVFQLRDSGPGIAPGNEERIFEKFYRAPSGASVGGTGLGLAICSSIVTAHGGALGVRSVPQGGAEFWFSLPIYEEEAAPGSSRSE